MVDLERDVRRILERLRTLAETGGPQAERIAEYTRLASKLLCAADGEPHTSQQDDRELIGVLASAVSAETELARTRCEVEQRTALLSRDAAERSSALSALREAEEQLRLTVDHAPIGISLVSLEGRWLRVNDAVCRILGYTREELLALDFQVITHPDDLDADLALLERLVRGEISTYSIEKRYLRRDGSVVWALLAVSLVRTPDGKASFFVSQIKDISERIEAARKTSEQAAILRAVIESMGDVVMVCDREGRLTVINEVAKRTFGPFLETGMMGAWEPDCGLFFADKVTRCELADYPIARALRGESVEQQELWMRMPGWADGRWHSVTGNPVRDPEGNLIGAVNVGRDVTARKLLEEQVRQTSLVDELTGLQNRRGFMLVGEQQLQSAARHGRGLFLLFADLDGLKRINDELGHEAGDRALADMANVLRATLRKSDVVARLGGDEFVVLGEGGREVASMVSERLGQRIVQHNATSGRPYLLSASIGVAHYDAAEAKGLSELLSSADKLMYDAKRRLKAARANRPDG